MLDVIFVPLEKWPGKPSKQKQATFRMHQTRRLDALEYELRKLRAQDMVIEAWFDHQSIRNDGWPKSSARPSGPGVILSFTGKDGPLSFPCDTYDRWEDNLYAIALSLEALRAVDRYGVTRTAEQYQGWKQLPAPAEEDIRDRKWALEHLARLAGVQPGILSDPATVDLAYRAAAKKTHPDVPGGSAAAFQVLQEAIGLIRGSV